MATPRSAVHAATSATSSPRPPPTAVRSKVAKLQAHIRGSRVRAEPRRAILNFHAATQVLRFKTAVMAAKGYASLPTRLTRKEKETTSVFPEDTGRPMFMFGKEKHPQKTKGGDLTKRWVMGKYEPHRREKVLLPVPKGHEQRESRKKVIEPLNHPDKQFFDTRHRVPVAGHEMGYETVSELALSKELQHRKTFEPNVSLRTGAALQVKDGRFGTLEGSMARRRKYRKNGTQITTHTPKNFMDDANKYPGFFKTEREAGLLMQQLRFSGGKAVFSMSGLKGKYSVFNGLYVPEESDAPVQSLSGKPVFRFKDARKTFGGTPVFLYYCTKNGGRPKLPAEEKSGDGVEEAPHGEANDSLDDATEAASNSSNKVTAAAAASSKRRNGNQSKNGAKGTKKKSAKAAASTFRPPEVVKEFEGWLICVGRSDSAVGPPKRRDQGQWISSTGGGAETPMNVGRWQTWNGLSWDTDKDIAAHFNAWPWALRESRSYADKMRETQKQKEIAEVEALLDFEEWDRLQASHRE